MHQVFNAMAGVLKSLSVCESTRHRLHVLAIEAGEESQVELQTGIHTYGEPNTGPWPVFQTSWAGDAFRAQDATFPATSPTALQDGKI